MPRSTHAIAPKWRWHSSARRQPETPCRVGGRRGHLWQLCRGVPVPCGTRARTCANSECCRTAQRHRQHIQMHLRLRMASWRKVISSSSRGSLDRTCNTTCRWAIKWRIVVPVGTRGPIGHEREGAVDRMRAPSIRLRRGGRTPPAGEHPVGSHAPTHSRSHSTAMDPNCATPAVGQSADVHALTDPNPAPHWRGAPRHCAPG